MSTPGKVSEKEQKSCARSDVQSSYDEDVTDAGLLKVYGFEAIQKAAFKQKHGAKYGRFFGHDGNGRESHSTRRNRTKASMW